VASAFGVALALERGAMRLHPRAGSLVAIVLAASAFATTDLMREATSVAAALRADDLPAARSRVARIVGRDTAHLDAADIARATIETLAESACDGIVAPLFWCALGGVPAVIAFKAVSTLDSMIGHRTPRFERFGAFAARLDDAANLVPARLTAALLAVLSHAPGRAMQTAVRDARGHASPNAGWPEAAMAGAFGIHLGGMNTYDGVPHHGPLFHAEGRRPDVVDVVAAIVLVRNVSLAAALLAIAASV
jgi:adenosylcobinamide-phosphate synthase